MDPKTSLALALSAAVAAVLLLPAAAADATDALAGPSAAVAECAAASPCVTIDASVVDGVLAYTVSPSAALDCGGATVTPSPSDDAITEIQVGCDPGSLLGFTTAETPCTEVGVEVEASGRAGGSGSSSCGSLSASCGVGSSGPSIACEDIDSGSSSGSWHCSLYVYAYSGGHASAKCWVVYG